ncbi:MAG TPA: hypothetical protein VE975_08365 [Actinomycetota bacterium]|jgi:hypothetical protein|nr:hypothetical protein [Actinomycetota bacterium]
MRVVNLKLIGATFGVAAALGVFGGLIFALVTGGVLLYGVGVGLLLVGIGVLGMGLLGATEPKEGWAMKRARNEGRSSMASKVMDDLTGETDFSAWEMAVWGVVVGGALIGLSFIPLTFAV